MLSNIIFLAIFVAFISHYPVKAQLGGHDHRCQSLCSQKRTDFKLPTVYVVSFGECRENVAVSIWPE